MASEIRVLEDQLYAADYENRVLRDKLERERLRQSDPTPDESTSPPTRRSTRPSTEPTPAAELTPAPRQSADEIDSMEEMLDELELDLPEVTPGVETEQPLTDPDFDPGPDPANTETEAPPGVEILPAPGGPEPPGKNDTDPEEIIPGEILPPPVSPEETIPPGQIQLPDSVQAGNGVPSGLRIHPSLSGGHRVEGETDGVMLVVNVVDPHGTAVDVSNFDIDGELSIVVLDPEREPDQARIGRWNFAGPQVAALVRTHPISGLHIPLKWQDEIPQGEEVIVHVRLRGEEDEMRCQRKISVQREPAVAEWSPRGESIR